MATIQDRQPEFKWENLWEKYRWQITAGVVGLILIGIGVLAILTIGQRQPAIEIIPAESEQQAQGTIFVHLGGAVQKPGVYELPAEARLNDLLVRAGGLSASADREWVEGSLNLAQKLSDGVKIYIPKMGETRLRQGSGGQSGKVVGTNISGKININTASTSQLDSLWGIGEKRATDIIKNRPYQSTEELLTRKIIPQNVYERIKDEISVY